MPRLRTRIASLACALVLLGTGAQLWAAQPEGAPASAHADHKPDAHADHKPESGAAPPASPAASAPAKALQAGQAQQLGAPVGPGAGVTEHLGAQAALDVTLLDEDGRAVRLAELVTMPTFLAPVYYSCPNECNVLLGTLSTVLPQVGLTPGTEYQVLAVSFDDRDTPATATKRKGDFFQAGSASGLASFPPQAWRFLTGSEAEVRRLMDSVGFGYKRNGDAFQHSIALIALSPTGKITRYLYGIRPLAFDIAIAATEAAEGKTGLSVKRAIAMCYTYDPQGRRYVFDFMKVAGAGVLAALGIFGLFLAFGGKKRTPKA